VRIAASEGDQKVNYLEIEEKLMSALRLVRRPVAVSFPEDVPEGVARFEGSVPSGCSFWRLAQAGEAFYTQAADHYNCPVGSYTHHIDLPEERRGELNETLGLMVETGYLKMEEVAGIPRLAETPRYVVYSPLGRTPVAPEAVIFAGTPGRIMLLQEAAMSAGIGSQFPILGRPACISIPASLSGGAVASSGCIGNRVYTDLDDTELYFTVRGKDLEKLASALDRIIVANRTLEQYHRGRRAGLATV
jgi:uncharacterized protein (DUF169 family)